MKSHYNGVFVLQPELRHILNGKPSLFQKLSFACALSDVVALLFLLPFILVALALPVVTVAQLGKNLWVATNPVPIQALVVAADTSDDDGSTNYHVKYQYQVGGRTYGAETQVDEALHAQARGATTIPVLYSASVPQWSYLQAHGPMGGITLWGMVFGTVLWDGLTLVFVLLMGQNWIKGWRVLARGSLLRGEVVRVDTDIRGEDDDFWLDVEYGVYSPAGQYLTGHKRQCRNDLRDEERPPAGTPVAVMYRSDDCHVML